MTEMLIVVATEEEALLAKKYFTETKILVTGVGGCNVVSALKDIPKTTPIINFGYAGSNYIPIGTKCRIGKCKLYHPNVEYKEPTYDLGGDTFCYTAGDFVLGVCEKKPMVFDMELAYIMALGFESVKSIKIVSDSLSIKEYEKTVAEAAEGESQCLKK